MTCSPLASRRRAIFGLTAPLLLSLTPDPADAKTRTRRPARHAKAASADVLPPERTLTTDPRLLDLIWLLRSRLESEVPVEVLCGYRTPETNAMLRRTYEGVAR